VRPICTSAAPVGPILSFLYSLYCFCSGPLVNNGAEHMNCLHKSYSLPGEIKLPGQDASPPVKVPKGMRSNRLRRQGPNAATALGVKRNGGTSRVAKSSSTVQDEFIKVCPHHHHQVTMCHCVLPLHCQQPDPCLNMPAAVIPMIAAVMPPVCQLITQRKHSLQATSVR